MLDSVLKQAMAALVIVLVYTIYRNIRNKTRVKLKNEDIKVKYLESKFSELPEIRIVKPYTKNSTWRVYQIANDTLGTKTPIYSVLDDELDNLIKSS